MIPTSNNPLIDIVSGTYQRLAHVTRMLESARNTVPSTLPIRFILVDGGSTDGTLEYLREQSDVLLIEHGELLGAIRAFCDGAKAATAPLVLMANDDITFEPGAILAALAHLDSHPRCGGVGFSDDRPAPGYEGRGFKVQTMMAFDPQLNEQVSVVYAQVGLFRRFLGDAVGWWGADHPVMSTGHSYGSDNFLSAGIIQLGYTIDEVPAARVRDTIPNDTLRERNYQIEAKNPGTYYRVYPGGPTIATTPTLPNPQREHLRVLLLTLYEPGYGRYKSGLRDALADVSWCVEWDYLNERGSLAEYVTAWQPHVLLMQLHSANDITQADIAAARSACPTMIVANWNGDTYREHLTSKPMLDLLRHIDLQLTVNAGVLPTYAANGIRAAYWQVAYEPVDYDALPNVAKHDVVFMGNVADNNEGRRRLGNGLRAIEGVDVGLYGFGWRFANGQTTYNFAAGAALYAAAKIAVGDNQFPDERGFVSNRIFEALASGAFLLHQRVDGLEELTGLQDGVHYIAWSDFGDLQEKIRKYLNPRHVAARKAIALAGCEFVRSRHSFAARVDELFEVLLPMIESERELA